MVVSLSLRHAVFRLPFLVENPQFWESTANPEPLTVAKAMRLLKVSADDANTDYPRKRRHGISLSR